VYLTPPFICVGYVALNDALLYEGWFVGRLHKDAVMAYVSAPLRHFRRITEENLGVRALSAEDSNPWIVTSALPQTPTWCVADTQRLLYFYVIFCFNYLLP
jgi:hypothetical protein